ncbi:colorectal cancer-associated protein 2 isoform X1 [Megalops cyprinoides]|uniref:colorectal cancer-associated protein 2 isoform X1 n=1 Tax=Megalops cyprinoides TaxID=118141 RepID=UPI001863CABC|nr:colorectal cancer-associated protein 2 isoform X1 [Megalops cyprinoides]
MSAVKPKVYQGVRVKATVKELLEKRRALQAAIKTTAISQSVAIQDVCSPSFPAYPFDVCPGNSMPDGSFQPRQYADNFCNVPIEAGAFDNQQLVNMMLPPESFSSSFLPPASAAPTWPHGHFASSADYYSHGMAPGSPSDSISLPSPADYSSYSPPQCYSSSSSCYSSPTRMDSGYGLAPECYHYQHCGPQHCYCVSHWSGPQDSVANIEYAPFGTSDSTYAAAVEENYFRRDMPNTEICYL